MIWIGCALGYIGIAGLIAAWLDHRNDDLHPFERVDALMGGAFWLPYFCVGLIIYGVNLLKGSGPNKSSE